MSSLLTQVVRRQVLTMVPRRHESALLIAGPPMNKVTNKVIINESFRSSELSFKFQEKLIGLALFFAVPMLYPIYIMMNLQKYNGSNRTWSKNKKSRSDTKQSGKKAD